MPRLSFLIRVVLVAWLLLLCLFSSAAATPAQQPAPPGEPNNTFGAATQIHLNSSLQGTIQPRGDADWYVIAADHPGELKINLTGSPPNLDMVVRVWNANRDVITDWFAPLKQGGDTQGVVDLPEAGRYYLEVHDGSDNAESDQPYTLTTAFTPTADNFEPNNTFGAATPLPFDQPIQANILPRGDPDWYVVEVDHHGELTVNITHSPANLEMVFRVWNANRDTITDWFAPLAQGGDTQGVIDLPAPGRYYLEVHDSQDNGRSIDPYTLQAAFTPSADVFEPNNSFGAATPLKFGVPVSATILPAGDADWFMVAAPHHGELKLSIGSVAPELAIAVRVWNSNRDVISDWFTPLSKGGETHGALDVAAPGRYYLEVVGGSGQRSIQPYSLRADFTAAPDSFEPNNDFGHATQLGVDRSAQATILPAGDADWFYFDVADPGQLHLHVSNIDPNLAVSVRVWNANRDTVSDWFRPLNNGGDTDGVFDIAAHGRYYLETAGGSGQRSLQPYTIQLGYALATDAHEPNDSFAAPTPIQLDQSAAGTIFPAGDSDWYWFAVPITGDLHVLITHLAPDLALSTRLWNAQQAPVSDWFKSPEPGKDVTAAISVTQAISYVLEVRGSDGNARSAQPYWLQVSMQPIDPAQVTGPAGSAAAPTPPAAPSTQPTQTQGVTTTAPVSPTGKVTVLTSGQIGPMGGKLFVTGKPGVDGARLTVPPGALDALTTIHLAVTGDAPAGAPFGLQPDGSFWDITPNGLTFKQPVTVTLPVPPGAAAPQMFIGHWNGQEWVSLGGTVDNGLISAATNGFSAFGVFCGKLEDYMQVTLHNASNSPYINLRYVAGPSPDPAHPEAFSPGCPLPFDQSQVWELKAGDLAAYLLRPGVYEFNVAYPQPQPGVANRMFLTIPPGGGKAAIEIKDDGATSDNPAVAIDFPGRQIVAGSNLRPLIACSADPLEGVTLANGDPAGTALPSRIVLASPVKLEQLPPKGPGLHLTASAKDPEGSQLRTYWTLSAGSMSKAGDVVASGAAIPDQSGFQPTVGGDYTIFLDVYDEKGLFDECRWVVHVEPNAQPTIKVFSGRTTVEFGRLDETRSGGVGAILPLAAAVRPGTAVPLAVPSLSDPGKAVAWDGLTLCPTAVAGPFAAIPEDLNTVVTTPAPVDVLLPTAGADATHRWQNPGRTCVWALTADANGDPLTTQWEFPGPIFGSGTFYAAVNMPAGFHPKAPDGIALGTFLRTNEQLEAYNAWISAISNLAGTPPAIVWEAWDDPCPPGSGNVQNPCPSAISLGGVENIVATTTDGFSQPPRTGYAPIAVLPEGEAEGGDCTNVFAISSLTPNPADPGAGQDVRVTARVAPLVEGCVIDMSIVGTDHYQNQAPIATNKSGEAAFFIPGGAEGVVDVVTARFCSPLPEGSTAPAGADCQTPSGKAGQWVEMKVTYTF